MTGSDADSSPLTFAIVPATGPTHGALGSITPINATSASVQYTPGQDYNGPDSFQFKVNDGTVDSTPATVSITVIAVNDKPVVTAGATLNYTENDPATVIDNTITVNDVDSANLVGATVQISGGLAEDVLSFTNNSGVSFVSYSGGLLTLTGTTTLVNYQAALRAVKYNNTSENPSIAARTVTWVVNDGSASNNLSTGVTSSIGVTAVNDKPVVTAGATLNYTENAIATVIDNTITVNDVDSTNLVGATAQISGGLAEDVLSFPSPTAGVSFVSFSGGLLTLTGTTTPANYQTALRAVKYNNTSDNPSTAARTVTWVVNDGAGANNLSTGVTSTVNVTAVNDKPVVTAGATLAYTENDGATVIDGTITVNDVDSPNLVGATVQISGGLAEDVLSFSNNSGVSFVSYSGGLLTLTGTTTPANYQTALRTVAYRDTSDNPSTVARTVTWVVDDGAAANHLSTGVTSTINITAVNDKPVVTAGATLPYTENAAATIIDGTITVNDVDSANLVGATVQISGGLPQDVLSFANTAGVSFVSYSGGLLTLSGTTTPANYQIALRTVKYNNTSDDPSTAVRTVTWIVNDGAAANNLSTGVTSTINVTAVNDPPTANAFAGLPAQAGIPITYPAGKLGGTDLEAGTTITIDTTPINVTAGSTVTINANGSFTFTPPSSAAGGSASFQYRVYDNGNPSGGPSPSGGAFSSYVTVSFSVAGPAIYFSKSATVGSGNCTLGNECTLATAVTNIGATGNRHIFINDAGNQSATSVTLNASGTIIGQGASGTTFATLYSISNPAQGTLAALPSLGQTPPTVGPVTLAASSVVRGVGISTSSATPALQGTSIASPAVLQTSVTSTGGSALTLNAVTTASITLDSLTASGGSASGVSFTNGSGSFTITTGSITGNASQPAFFMSGGSNAVSYGGTITQTAANKLVSIASTTGGGTTISGNLSCTSSCTGISVSSNGNATSANTIAFSGGTKTFSTAGNAAVTLSSNTGATINFSGGGLGITTTSGAGITATGGGTVSVTTGANANTISSTTGTALNVASTTIGASGLTFQSISSNGAANGISLSSTGTTGGLTVTGNSAGHCGGIVTVNAVGTPATVTAPDTADCTGGTIQASTGIGITLSSVGTVSLTRVRVLNSGTTSIKVNGATGFTLDHSLVTDAVGNGTDGGATDEGVNLINVSGTVTISNDTIDSAPHNQIFVDNNNTNMTAFNMSGSTIKCTSGPTNACTPAGIPPNNVAVGGSGAFVQIRGNSVLTSANVQNNVFSGVRGTGISVNSGDTARIGASSGGIIAAPALSNSFTVQNNTFAGNNVGVDISQSQVGNAAFQILSNTINGRVTPANATSIQASAQAINAFSATGTDTGPASHFHVGKIDGNVIGTQGVKDSGAGFGNGIRVVIQGDNTQGNVTVSNNTIREVPNAGNGIISILGQNGNGANSTLHAGTSRFSLINNVMPQNSGTNLSLGCGGDCTDDGIFVLADENFPVCAAITGNNIYDVTTGPGGAFDVYLAPRTGPPAGATITIQGSGSALTFINANNTLAGANKSFAEAAVTTAASCGTFN